MKTDFEHRKFVYKFARSVLFRKASTQEEIEYAISLLSPIESYKALGLRQRLERKLVGESFRWGDF